MHIEICSASPLHDANAGAGAVAASHSRFVKMGANNVLHFSINFDTFIRDSCVFHSTFNGRSLSRLFWSPYMDKQQPEYLIPWQMIEKATKKEIQVTHL